MQSTDDLGADLPTTWEEIDALTGDNDGRGNVQWQRALELGRENNGKPPQERSPELADHMQEAERDLRRTMPAHPAPSEQLHPAERIALRNATLNSVRPSPARVRCAPRTVRRAESSGRPSGRSAGRRAGASSSTASADPGDDSSDQPPPEELDSALLAVARVQGCVCEPEVKHESFGDGLSFASVLHDDWCPLVGGNGVAA